MSVSIMAKFQLDWKIPFSFVSQFNIHSGVIMIIKTNFPSMWVSKSSWFVDHGHESSIYYDPVDTPDSLVSKLIDYTPDRLMSGVNFDLYFFTPDIKLPSENMSCVFWWNKRTAPNSFIMFAVWCKNRD